MADNRRAARVGSAVQNALGTLLAAELKDPRLAQAGIISVTGVRVTADLSLATVYVSATNDTPEHVEQMLVGFASAANFLRGEVARRVSLKRVPELRFRLDPAVGHGRRIETILRELGESEE
jgi:ribosome-binding factor A